MTVLSDNFNRADSTSSLGSSAQGWAWNPLSGTWGITSNKAYLFATAGAASARAESDLSSLDHYCQCVVSNATLGIGPCVRFSAAAETFYHVRVSTTTTLTLFRFVAGTGTSLGTITIPTAAGGEVLRLEASGVGATVTLVTKWNGVTVSTIGDTNAARLVSGLRTGLRAGGVSALRTADDFEAGDLSAGSAFLGSYYYRTLLGGVAF